MSLRRIAKEARDYDNSINEKEQKQDEDFTLKFNYQEDAYCVHATFTPTSGPYQGGTYEALIQFPSNYPFRPPSFRFTSTLLHPGVAANGMVCCCSVDLLGTTWSPAITLRKLVKVISERIFEEPEECECGGDMNLAILAKRDPAEFRLVVLDWARVNASRIPWTPSIHMTCSKVLRQRIGTFFKAWHLSRRGFRKTVLGCLPYELWLIIAQYVYDFTFSTLSSSTAVVRAAVSPAHRALTFSEESDEVL